MCLDITSIYHSMHLLSYSDYNISLRHIITHMLILYEVMREVFLLTMYLYLMEH